MIRTEPSIVNEIVDKIENALRDNRRLIVDELSAMFPQISRSLLHETTPRILETVREVCPKTADRPTRVESSGSRARVFETPQTPWR